MQIYIWGFIIFFVGTFAYLLSIRSRCVNPVRSISLGTLFFALLWPLCAAYFVWQLYDLTEDYGRDEITERERKDFVNSFYE